MVEHNFKVGDTIKTVSHPYETEFQVGGGYKPDITLTICDINQYSNYIVVFFKESFYGIRWSETHPNFYLINYNKIYELW